MTDEYKIRLITAKETMINCNNKLMGYFDNWLQHQKKQYKPKLKETKEHKEAIHKLFKEMLEEAEKEAA